MIPTEALQCAEQYAAHAHHFWNSGMGGTECRKLEDSPQMLRLHLWANRLPPRLTARRLGTPRSSSGSRISSLHRDMFIPASVQLALWCRRSGYALRDPTGIPGQETAARLGLGAGQHAEIRQWEWRHWNHLSAERDNESATHRTISSNNNIGRWPGRKEKTCISLFFSFFPISMRF